MKAIQLGWSPNWCLVSWKQLQRILIAISKYNNTLPSIHDSGSNRLLGASFDEEGMYNPWWTKKTLQTFDFKKRGLVEQYNGYSTSAGSVNGELTIGENIADNGGLKAAYKVAWCETTLLHNLKFASFSGLSSISRAVAQSWTTVTWSRTIYRRSALLYLCRPGIVQ